MIELDVMCVPLTEHGVHPDVSNTIDRTESASHDRRISPRAILESQMQCTARAIAKGTAVIALLAFPCVVFAHEKWFADANGYPTQWEQIFRFPQIVGVLLALAVTIVLAIVWRRTRQVARCFRGRRHSAPRPTDAHAFTRWCR